MQAEFGKKYFAKQSENLWRTLHGVTCVLRAQIMQCAKMRRSLLRNRGAVRITISGHRSHLPTSKSWNLRLEYFSVRVFQSFSFVHAWLARLCIVVAGISGLEYSSAGAKIACIPCMHTYIISHWRCTPTGTHVLSLCVEQLRSDYVYFLLPSLTMLASSVARLSCLLREIFFCLGVLCSKAASSSRSFSRVVHVCS